MRQASVLAFVLLGLARSQLLRGAGDGGPNWDFLNGNNEENGGNDLWAQLKKNVKDDWNAMKKKLGEGVESVEEGAEDLWKDVKQEFQPDNNDDSEESKESDEETSTEDKLVRKCSSLCMLGLPGGRDGEQDEERQCRAGCRGQQAAALQIQAQFPHTSHQLLLGSALDKCWDGCGEEAPCTAGCDTMRTLQKSQLKEAFTESDTDSLEKKANDFKKRVLEPEIYTNDIDMALKDNAYKEAKKQEKEEMLENTMPENGGIEHPRILTYVLWRPSFSSEGLPSLTQEDAMRSYGKMVALMQSLMGDFDLPKDTEQIQGPGWRDDRMQLRIPETSGARASARTGEGLYSRVAESLDSIKQRVEATVSNPGFQLHLYYILMGLSGFLLITTAINAVFNHSEERTGVQDHYYLEGKASGAKLPSYDDCIKADKDMLIDITNQDYFTKEKLPLPTFVVLDPVVVPAAETDTTSETAKNNENEA